MLRFTVFYWLAFVFVLSSGEMGEPVVWLALYLCVMVPWALWRALVTLWNAIPEKKEVYWDRPKEEPAPPPPPTPKELAAAARDRYEMTLRMLSNAGLDEIELRAARAKAKQKYLRDLDEAMT